MPTPPFDIRRYLLLDGWAWRHCPRSPICCKCSKMTIRPMFAAKSRRTLALIGGSAAKTSLPTVIKSLQNDKSDEVRRQLALTLGKMGDIKPVIKEVLDVLKSDKDRTVRLYLVRSIPTCLGSGMKDHVKDYADWLNKEPDADVRLAIIQELGALGPAGKEALDATRGRGKRCRSPGPRGRTTSHRPNQGNAQEGAENREKVSVHCGPASLRRPLLARPHPVDRRSSHGHFFIG